MAQKKKRFYKVGERVFVKPEKTFGEIVELDIDPKAEKFKAVVEIETTQGDATIVRKRKYDLWEIDKDKSELFRKQRNQVLNFAKVREDAIIPTKEDEDGGYDIYANFEQDYIFLHPNTVTMIPTGVASAFSDDYVLLARERGSTGVKGMSVRAGVIDSGFRGEIKILLNNTTDKTIVIAKDNVEITSNDENTVIYPYKKAIAQLLLMPVPKVDVKEITFDELQSIPSKRGEGMLGQSGK